MTKSVTLRALTAHPALVLSPLFPPARPADEPKIFEDFERVVAAIGAGAVLGAYVGGRFCLEGRPGGMAFTVTALLADGRTGRGLLPEGWDDRVTKDVVSEFLQAQPRFFERPPDWGVYSPVRAVDVNARTIVMEHAVAVPLIDPVHDGARIDDDSVLPLAVEFPTPWDEFLQGWEHLDGYFGRADPNTSWMRRRRRLATAASGRWWLEVRGVWDADDGERYDGHWAEPMDVTAYLGWPAYLLDIAGETRACKSCGKPTPTGRRYCGTPHCNKIRTRTRQRDRRAGPRGQRAGPHQL